MWFATPNGLYSYDGYRFTTYVHDSLNLHSLAANYVESIYADSNGIIWIGTLQPYVENAIWHGLMHKEEKGHLDIEISEKDDQLFLTIRDDGVGREKAKAMASKSATKHKSMGLRITENRIANLQKNGSQGSPVTIHDLVSDDGTAAGTEVIIKMPLIYD